MLAARHSRNLEVEATSCHEVGLRNVEDGTTASACCRKDGPCSERDQHTSIYIPNPNKLLHPRGCNPPSFALSVKSSRRASQFQERVRLRPGRMPALYNNRSCHGATTSVLCINTVGFACFAAFLSASDCKRFFRGEFSSPLAHWASGVRV